MHTIVPDDPTSVCIHPKNRSGQLEVEAFEVQRLVHQAPFHVHRAVACARRRHNAHGCPCQDAYTGLVGAELPQIRPCYRKMGGLHTCE